MQIKLFYNNSSVHQQHYFVKKKPKEKKAFECLQAGPLWKTARTIIFNTKRNFFFPFFRCLLCLPAYYEPELIHWHHKDNNATDALNPNQSESLIIIIIIKKQKNKNREKSHWNSTLYSIVQLCASCPVPAFFIQRPAKNVCDGISYLVLCIISIQSLSASRRTVQ